MKLSGIAGTGSGKLGSHVFAAVSGEQVVRQYQPNVSNPNTSKQVDQRAKMKLMSQLSAAMSSVIVIPRQGLKSSRNLFVKKNFSNVMAVSGQALTFLEKIQLTAGSSAFPRVGMERQENDKLSIFVEENIAGQYDRVVFNLFARNEEGELMLVNSIVQENAGTDGDFVTEVDDYDSELFLYAYGMKDTNAKAKAAYGNYIVESGEDIAKLLMSRKLSMSDYEISETSGNSLQVDEQSTVTVPEGSVLVRYSIVGDGAVRANSAAGAVVQKQLVKLRGSRFKWFAVPNSPYKFVAWRWFSDGMAIQSSSSNPVEFTAWGDLDVVVEFGV